MMLTRLSTGLTKACHDVDQAVYTVKTEPRYVFVGRQCMQRCFTFVLNQTLRFCS